MQVIYLWRLLSTNIYIVVSVIYLSNSKLRGLSDVSNRNSAVSLGLFLHLLESWEVANAAFMIFLLLLSSFKWCLSAICFHSLSFEVSVCLPALCFVPECSQDCSSGGSPWLGRAGLWGLGVLPCCGITVTGTDGPRDLRGGSWAMGRVGRGCGGGLFVPLGHWRFIIWSPCHVEVSQKQ